MSGRRAPWRPADKMDSERRTPGLRHPACTCTGRGRPALSISARTEACPQAARTRIRRVRAAPGTLRCTMLVKKYSLQLLSFELAIEAA